MCEQTHQGAAHQWVKMWKCCVASSTHLSHKEYKLMVKPCQTYVTWIKKSEKTIHYSKNSVKILLLKLRNIALPIIFQLVIHKKSVCCACYTKLLLYIKQKWSGAWKQNSFFKWTNHHSKGLNICLIYLSVGQPVFICLYESWNSHKDEYQDYGLLGCDTM
jgi:hypothetical protein